MPTRVDMEVSKEHANGIHHKRAGTVIGILEPNPLVEVEDQCSLAKHRISESCRAVLHPRSCPLSWTRKHLRVSDSAAPVEGVVGVTVEEQRAH